MIKPEHYKHVFILGVQLSQMIKCGIMCLILRVNVIKTMNFLSSNKRWTVKQINGLSCQRLCLERVWMAPHFFDATRGSVGNGSLSLVNNVQLLSSVVQPVLNHGTYFTFEHSGHNTQKSQCKIYIVNILKWFVEEELHGWMEKEWMLSKVLWYSYSCCESAT